MTTERQPEQFFGRTVIRGASYFATPGKEARQEARFFNSSLKTGPRLLAVPWFSLVLSVCQSSSREPCRKLTTSDESALRSATRTEVKLGVFYVLQDHALERVDAQAFYAASTDFFKPSSIICQFLLNSAFDLASTSALPLLI